MTCEFVLHQERVGDITLKIVADPDSINPREEFDLAATMACWHRRYRLGDDRGCAALTAAIRASGDYRDSWERTDAGVHHRGLDLTRPGDIAYALPKCRDIVWMPLYLFDHNGITISTGPFACPWDSGQVGFVFMTKAQIMSTLAPNGATRLGSLLRRRTIELMSAEVAEYDQYLTGDIWGYIVADDDEQLDSCWGYFGARHCTEEGRAAASAADAERRRKRAETYAEEA